ncbi:hypothetical protein [Actinoplanes sp. NPDC051411]|uniref:hypothetical protein n=1 Tax=Actinoplanes sp. NPDC051411 TaxID=3155522 RepID=UPI0034266B60
MGLQPLRFVLEVLGLLGNLALAMLLLVFVKELVEAVLIRRRLDLINAYRSVPPTDLRSLVTLPLASALIGIVSGVGVNIATGGSDISTGVYIIVGGVALVIYLGCIMALNPLRVDDPDRKVLTYLSQVEKVMHDPFVYLDQVEGSIPRLKRLRCVGQRLQATPRDRRSIRLWLRENLDDETRRAIIAGPSLSVFIVFLWLLNWALGEWAISQVISRATIVALACMLAIAMPFLARFNRLERRKGLGRFIAERSSYLIGLADRAKRMQDARLRAEKNADG